MQPDFQTAADDEYHAAELLRFHDREFLRNAYFALLKRAPDASGFEVYLERLRAGELNKIDVLGKLRYSPEGERREVRIKGLRFPFLLRRAGRLPAVGYLLRWLTTLARLPSLVQSHTQFSHYATAQFELIAEHVNDLAAHHTAERERIATHLTERLAHLSEAHQQLRHDLIAHVAEQRARLAEIDEQVAHQAMQMARSEARLDHSEARLDHSEARLDHSEVRLDQSEARLGKSEVRLDNQESLAAYHNARFEQYGKLLEDVQAQLETLWQDVEQMRTQTIAPAAALRDELHALKQMTQQTLVELTLQEQDFKRASQAAARQEAERGIQDVERGIPAANSSQHATAPPAPVRFFTDAMYAAFEDRFRGSGDEIKERLSVYLPLVREAPAGGVLDLGSGRGEWLELLRAEGRSAQGVDSNRVFIADCRARGLDVIEGDALAHLRSLEANSLAAVTGLHLVEHLPLDVLIELLNETLRVLMPGGLALFETPDPENVLVGSHFFYVDPTHRNPLPSLTMKFFLESRGFDRVQVMRLHPYESAVLPRMNERDHTTARFNELFYAAMDYGIGGWKPE